MPDPLLQPGELRAQNRPLLVGDGERALPGTHLRGTPLGQNVHRAAGEALTTGDAQGGVARLGGDGAQRLDLEAEIAHGRLELADHDALPRSLGLARRELLPNTAVVGEDAPRGVGPPLRRRRLSSSYTSKSEAWLPPASSRRSFLLSTSASIFASCSATACAAAASPISSLSSCPRRREAR